MAELPEITKLAGQMKKTLRGKTIKTVALLQEKCSNVSADEFQKRTENAKITDVSHKGKWIITSLDNNECILLSLGMGADILYFENKKKEKDMPEKYQIKILFADGSGYTARFWWFGKFLLVLEKELASEPNTKNIAIDPFDKRFTLEYFSSLLKGKKTQIKAFLMDQKNIGGIGNMYMHDILFKARLHPQKKISDMSGNEIKLLYSSIIDVLNLSHEKGALAYESDFFGQKGGFKTDDFLVGYKENGACPVCGENIISIKTGSTSTFICPACQK
jgi:formamidopyrimidine-DNA glycosylase